MKKHIIGAILLGVLTVQTAFTIIAQPANAYSTDQINWLTPNGVAGAAQWDNFCKESLRENWNAGLGIRPGINKRASYAHTTWISPRGRPNISNPITIASATTSIPLQLNSVTFVCAPLVSPKFYGGKDSLYSQILNDSSRWVTPTDARDRYPNPTTGHDMSPALTGINTQIVGMSIVNGPAGSVTVDAGQYGVPLKKVRDDYSRYWFANNLRITYTATNPITESTRLTVRLYYKAINQYRHNTNRCFTMDDRAIDPHGFDNFSICDTFSEDLVLDLSVPKGHDIDGQSYAVAGSAGSGYTTYKNYNNSQPNGLNGAINHDSESPTVKPGELARFSSTLKNVPLAGYGRENADMWIEVQNSYFPTYQDVAHYAAASWNSFGHDTTTVISRNRPLANTQCMDSGHREARGIILAPDSTHQFNHTDDCTAARVPSDGSKIGWYVCQKTWWYYANSINIAWTNTTPACFVVKSTFNLIPKIGDGSTSIGATNQDTQVDLPSIIQNEGGILRNIGVDWGTYDFRIPNSVIQSAGGESAVTTVFNQIFNKTSSGSLRYAEADFGSTAHACEWMKDNPSLHNYASDCNTLASAIISALNSGSNQVNNEKLKTAGAQVGDLVCRTMTIRHYNWDTRAGGDTHRRVAYPKCYRIAKKPSVHVWGNGVRVGSNSGVVAGLPATQYTRSSIITAMSSLADSGQLFGSWGEYGMTTPQNGVIRSASAGGLSGVGVGAANASTSAEAARNNLSFANANIPGGGYGKWGTISAQPNIGGQFTSNVRNHAGNVSLSSMAPGVYNATAHVVKISGEVGAGKSIIIKSAGTVIIDGNITYAPSRYHTSSDITQLVIVASNIIIRDNVTQVDAWLAATPSKDNTQDGIVSTCEIDETPNLTAIRARGVNYANGLNANTCNRQLRINGPVLARELQLRRTFGSDRRGAGDIDGFNDPAEIINMRADAYLWAANYISNTTGNITTDYTVELPPRY